MAKRYRRTERQTSQYAAQFGHGVNLATVH
jgi:hypothetical protein